MLNLNLPTFEYKVKKAAGKLYIFDVIRKKYVMLEPEEWVRQHFIHFLIGERKYPRSLVKVESGLKYNSLSKRSDILVFDRTGAPWMVVECKAPDIKIDDKVVFQAAVYNETLRAPFLTVSNGLQHLYATINWEQGTTQWLDQLPAFPSV